jgi:hydroxyacylglutathione hydrolase
MLEIKSFTFNAFQENTYVIFNEGKDGIVIDPGCYDILETDEIDRFIKEKNINITLLVNTHCHVDHVLGNNHIGTKYKVPLAIHKIDLDTLRSVKAYAPAYGFHFYSEYEPSQFLEEGDEIEINGEVLKILFVPGHAPGHIALLYEKGKYVVAGDTLFRQSIGRTDLPGGDYITLIDSIRTKLFCLKDGTTVYCGHGPSTIIGYEKLHNSFLQD